MTPTITPAWLTLEGASQYSGLSSKTVERMVKDNLIVSSNCRLPGNSKGRRLIKRESLDAFIEGGIDATPVKERP